MTTRTEKTPLPEVNEKDLDGVTGGYTSPVVISPIPKSHACTSGQDPTTQDPIFSALLAD